MIFLAVALIFASWPIRNFLLVRLRYGTDAYFSRAAYVLPIKPIPFSNGELAPIFPDLITGFCAFFITVFGLSFSLFVPIRFYDRPFGK